MRVGESMREAFWALVEKSDGCWRWTGRVDRKGYGMFSRRPRIQQLAHRWSYHFAVGPIPEGMCVLHRCDNPICVNPDHLFLGSKRDNSDDRDRKGRQARGTRQPQAKLTEQSVADIKSRLASGETCRALAAEYGVSWGLISHIKTGRNWRHVELGEAA